MMSAGLGEVEWIRPTAYSARQRTQVKKCIGNKSCGVLVCPTKHWKTECLTLASASETIDHLCIRVCQRPVSP